MTKPYLLNDFGKTKGDEYGWIWKRAMAAR